jgi:hypothetical protein
MSNIMSNITNPATTPSSDYILKSQIMPLVCPKSSSNLITDNIAPIMNDPNISKFINNLFLNDNFSNFYSQLFNQTDNIDGVNPQYTNTPTMTSQYTNFPTIGSQYTEGPYMEDSHYTEGPYMEDSHYTEGPYMEDSQYTEGPYMEDSQYTEGPYTDNSQYTEGPYMEDSQYTTPTNLKKNYNSDFLPITSNFSRFRN